MLADDDEGKRATALGLLEALSAFFVAADAAKDRKHASTTCEKQMRRLMRTMKDHLDDFDIDRISDSAMNLLSPPHKRFSEQAKARPTPAPMYAQLAEQPAPIYYQQHHQLPPVYAARSPQMASYPQPACPPGYQLAAPSAGPPGGGRLPSRGIAATKPLEVFPPGHFIRPCAYCAHAGHAGDHCWKTYPELRALNGQ